MGESTARRAANFFYIAADGRRYRVSGRFVELAALQWVRFDLLVKSEDPTDTVGRVFCLPKTWSMDVPPGNDPLGRDEESYWSVALRRFAIDQTVNDLDAGSLSEEPVELNPQMADSLRRFALRECDFQEMGEDGDLWCGKDASGIRETTLRICNECAVPDPWERCRYVCNVQTHGSPASGCVVMDRTCCADCQVGLTPLEVGGVPSHCRWTENPPQCFTPREIGAPRAPAELDRAASAAGLLSHLNVAWKRSHGFPLFRPVSFAPLFELTASCANASEYHYRVLALAELMTALDKEGLRDQLDPDTATPIGKAHTLSLLGAVLTKLSYPNGETAVELLRNVYALRNLEPTHPPDWKAGETAMAAVGRLGFGPHIAQADWPRLWTATLAMFARGVELILRDVETPDL